MEEEDVSEDDVDRESNNCKENEQRFQELGQQMCEEIGELTKKLAEEGKNEGGFSSEAYLQQLDCFDESFAGVPSCSHVMTDAKVTKCVSKLLLTEVRNVYDRTGDKEIDVETIAQTLLSFLQKHCGLDEEPNDDNLLASWAAFGARFMNDIFKPAPGMSCLGPLLPPEMPKEVTEAVQVKKKAERTKKKGNEEVLELQEIDAEELVKRTDPLAKQLDNVMHCLKQYLKEHRTKSINYFQFCFHPTDFSRTVDNVFYTSFLVKENKVLLDIGDDKLPRLTLLGKNEQAAALANENTGMEHACISFSYEEWEQMVKLLDITVPIITDI